MDLEGLIENLKKAPQEKEGAFRISTWLMVLEELKNIKDSLNLTKQDLDNTKVELQENIQTELKNNLANEDSDVILF